MRSTNHIKNELPATNRFSDPFPFIVKSKGKPLSSDLIFYILSFSSSDNLLIAFFVSKLWLKIITAEMQKRLNKNPDGTIATNNPLHLNDKNTRLYFFGFTQANKSSIVDLTVLNPKEKHAKIIQGLHNQLMLAIEKACDVGDDEKLAVLLNRAAYKNINLHWEVQSNAEASTAESNWTMPRALHIAASNGHTSCLELLLDNGALPNQMSNLQDADELVPPLMLALQKNHVNAIFVLLSRGASLTEDILWYAEPPVNNAIAQEINNLRSCKVDFTILEKKFIEHCFSFNKEGLQNHLLNDRSLFLKNLHAIRNYSPSLFESYCCNILTKDKLSYTKRLASALPDKTQTDLIDLFLNELIIALKEMKIKNSDLKKFITPEISEQQSNSRCALM